VVARAGRSSRLPASQATVVLAVDGCYREVVVNMLQGCRASAGSLPACALAHLLAAALLSMGAMVGCAAICAAPTGVAKERLGWRNWARLGASIAGLTAVAAFAAWEALLDRHYERMGARELAIVWCSFGTAALPFVISALVFRQDKDLGMGLWGLALALGTPLLLIIRWKFRLPAELSELAGVWLVAGGVGYLWASRYCRPRSGDSAAGLAGYERQAM